MQKMIRLIWISSWYAFAILAVITAVSLSAARVLLPMANDFNAEIESHISDLIHQPIQIDGLDAEWYGLGPKLVIKNVSLLDKPNGKAIARFDKAFLGFNLLSLLTQGQLGLRNIAVSGINLYIERLEDGSISIGGTRKNSGNSAIDNTLLEDWILKQTHLSIERTNITWHDRKLKYKPVKLSNVELKLINENNNHKLKGKVILPENMGKKLSFALDVTGNPFHSNKIINGVFYINGENIRPGEFILADNIINLETDLELWSTWSNGELTKITGDIKAYDAILQKKKQSNKNETAFKLQQLSGIASWEKAGQGWKLNVNNFSIKRNGKTWPKTNIKILWNSTDLNKLSTLEVQTDFMRIEDTTAAILQLAKISEKNKTAITSKNPVGDLHDLSLKYTANKNNPKLLLETIFKDISIAPTGTVPGVKGLNGAIVINESTGSLAINSEQTTVYLPDLFRDPIPVKKLNGTFHWKTDLQSLKIVSNNLHISNNDLDTNINLNLDIPTNKISPFIDLSATFKNGDTKQISRYIPYKRLSSKLVNWIDNSFIDGDILSGAMTLHGRLSDFPFNNGKGQLQVNAYTNNVSINYKDGWPLLSKAAGKVDINNEKIIINAHQGKILDSDISDTQITFNNWLSKNPVLNIKGKVTGSTQDKLKYLQATLNPNTNFSKNLQSITMKGQSVLDLDFLLNLGRTSDHKKTLAGIIHLKDNSLAVKYISGDIWNQLNGQFSFVNNNLNSKTINGLFFDYPATLNISTQTENDQKSTYFATTGSFMPEHAIKRFIPSWSKHFSGSSQWKVNLNLPHSPVNGKNSNKPTLTISSNLKNIEINTPAPFRKEASETTNLDISAELSARQHKINIKYGPLIQGYLELDSNKNKIKINRGIINYNDPTNTTLPKTGIKLSGKNVDHFSYDDWYKFITATPEFKTEKPKPGRGPLSWFSFLDADIKQLDAFGQSIHNASIKATNRNDHWDTNISSDEMSGKINLPLDSRSSPIIMTLNKFLIYPEKLNIKHNNKKDPRNWPAINITSKLFAFDDTEYGSMVMTLNKTKQGLKLDKLKLSNEFNTITGTGHWNYDGSKHSSHIELLNTSNNIGKTMSSMGYADSINKGKGTFSLDLDWPGMPQEFSRNNITGNVALNFRDGQLTDINPGAGRIFGLLSLQTLPRRLFLDFRDVFTEGFSFDEIKGSFNIGGGDAYTSDLHLSGPAARIAISGRTGLVDEDYDQLVTVIPNAAGSVPMLTVLAGAEPITALVTWTLKNIFQSQIDEAIRIEYTITGGWAN